VANIHVKSISNYTFKIYIIYICVLHKGCLRSNKFHFLRVTVFKYVVIVDTFPARAGLRHVFAPNRLIIWGPFKLTFFKLLWPRTGPTNLHECLCQNFLQSLEKFSHIWTPEFTSTIFLIIPVTS